LDRAQRKYGLSGIDWQWPAGPAWWRCDLAAVSAQYDGAISGNGTNPARESMKPSIAFQIHRDAIRRIVEGHRACNPRVFGSVLQGCDIEGSDLDLLIDPTAETTLLDIGAIRHELLELLGVPVDVLTPKALPDKFRASVLAEAIPI
jgi:predicted nucleotidyltransferase